MDIKQALETALAPLQVPHGAFPVKNNADAYVATAVTWCGPSARANNRPTRRAYLAQVSVFRRGADGGLLDNVLSLLETAGFSIVSWGPTFEEDTGYRHTPIICRAYETARKTV